VRLESICYINCGTCPPYGRSARSLDIFTTAPGA
jgi:hypothetical protein